MVQEREEAHRKEAIVVRILTRVLVAAVSAVALALAVPRRAQAHCDTMDGPTVADGRRALESGDVNHALRWVDADHEVEVTAAFDLAQRVRGLSADARELADRYFLETLVRLHRAGEGAPYTGILPAGVSIDARVAAADRAIVEGSMDALAALVPADQVPELQRRFERVLARKDFELADLGAGREYVAAYMDFFHLAEGHAHEHERHDGAHHEHGDHEHEHGHEHGDHEHGHDHHGHHDRGHSDH